MQKSERISIGNGTGSNVGLLIRFWCYAHCLNKHKGEKMPIGVNCFTDHEYVKCVNVVSWSPDGQFLAAGSSDGTVRVWEIGTWKVVAALDTRDWRRANAQGRDVLDAIAILTWSLDGMAIQIDGIGQWNISTGTLRTEVLVPISTLQIARTHATFGGYYGIIPKVYQESVHSDFHQSPYIMAYCMDESPNRQQIVYGSSHAIEIWNVKQWEMVQSYMHHIGSVMCVAWSPDGSLIASGSYDKSIQICEADTGEVRCVCISHENVILDICWSPDGQRLASSSWDKTVCIWNVLTGECLYKYEGHTGPINSIAWSPDGYYLASGSWDHTVQVWEAA